MAQATAAAAALTKPTQAPLSVIERRKLKAIRLQEIQSDNRNVDSPLSSGSKDHGPEAATTTTTTGEGNRLASAEKDLSFWDEMAAATQTSSTDDTGPSSQRAVQASSG